MKRILLLSLMTFIAVCSQAQFYSSEACFFLEAGKEPKSLGSGTWMVILFKGKEAFASRTGIGFESIQNGVKNDPNYFDKKDCSIYKDTYVYSPTSSTNSEYVYDCDVPGHYVGYSFGSVWIDARHDQIVLNKEKSSLVYYPDRNSRKGGCYYIMIPKSEAIKLFTPGINNSFME